MMQKAKQANVC